MAAGVWYGILMGRPMGRYIQEIKNHSTIGPAPLGIKPNMT